MSERLNEFDQYLRDMLQEHKVPYDEQSWDQLEAKLNRVELQEQEAVDRVARKALENYAAPYNHSTWHILSDRLDRMSYRNRVIGTKVMEAAVILLAILTMVKFLGQIPDQQRQTPMMTQNQVVEKLDKSDQDVSPATTQLTLDDAEGFDNKDIMGSVQSEFAVGNLASKTDALIPRLEMRFFPVSIFEDKSLVSRDGIVQRESDFVSKLESRNNDPLKDRITPIEIHEESDLLPPLPSYDLAMLEAETATDFHLASAPPNNKVKTKLSVFREISNNLILNDPVYGTKQVEQWQKSRGGGISANVQFGRVGFDMGLIYSELDYKAGLGRNEVRKVQLPVSLRADVIEGTYGKFYAKAGGSAHGVTRAHYEKNPDASAGGPRRKAPHFNDGLLENGETKNNVFYTLHAGMGFEVPIRKKLAIVGEAAYQRHLDGKIGLTNDKIQDAFTARFGVSYSLQ